MAAHHPKHAGPIHVACAAKGGRHAFDHPSDPRIQLTFDAWPDVVVLPAAREAVLKTSAELISPRVRERILDRRAVLVLDASGEGPAFTPQLASTIHRLLRDLALPAKCVAYLTQNRDFQTAYVEWCGSGVRPVKVVTHDDYLSRFFLDHAENGREIFTERLAAFEARSPEREKRFVCLNYSIRTAKVMLLLAMLRDGLWDEGFISFPGFDATKHVRAVRKPALERDLTTVPGLEALGAALKPWLDALDAKGASMLGAASGARKLKSVAEDSELEEYDHVWFSLINETEVVGTRRVTEKPFKALANFSPVLMWGNPHSLALLRDFGFETFGGLVDKAYDAEPDPAVRFEMVYGELKRLCAMPQEKLARLERDLAGTLAFNADRALVHMPRVYREEIEPRLLDAVLDLAVNRTKP